jgi:hypothetical protein
MSTEIKKEIQLQIAHVLFIDIVRYSKLSINDQHAAVEELKQIVRVCVRRRCVTIHIYPPLAPP